MIWKGLRCLSARIICVLNAKALTLVVSKTVTKVSKMQKNSNLKNLFVVSVALLQLELESKIAASTELTILTLNASGAVQLPYGSVGAQLTSVILAII
jgi:hypothetical protein